MPQVDGKHFAYTEKGKVMAKKAKKLLKKKRLMTDGGYMPRREK